MTIHSFFEQIQLTFQLNKEELSVSHPLLLKFLNETSHDPDVARLIDAFVYSYGALNAHETKHFSELPRSLISLFWPHLLKPVPSTTVVKFKYHPKSNSRLRTNEHIIPALTKITTSSISVKKLGESIRTSDNLEFDDDDLNLPIEFRTTGALRLSAFSEAELKYTEFQDHNQSAFKGLEIKFTTQDNHFSLNDITQLQFFMGDDLYTGKQLFLWLTQYLDAAVFIINGIEYPQEGLGLSVPALKEQMPLIPFPKNVFQGYRLLLEYFSFPENFLFCKLDNLKLPNQVYETSEITLLLTFNRDLPHDMQLTSKTIQLNCVPAVNLFHKDLEPITLDGKKINYPLMPKLNANKYYDIYEIHNVFGYLLKKVPLRKKRHYWPFESFSHQNTVTLGRGTTDLELYYQHLIQEDHSIGGFKHALALKRSDELEHIGDEELIAVSALCTNRYAASHLSVGDLNLIQLTDLSVKASNITRPTIPLYPTLSPYLLDILMSGLVLNSSSLLNKDTLIMALSLYDFAGMNDSAHANLAQLRDGAIDELQSFSTQMYYDEVPVDGIKTIMSVKQIGVFESEGDLYLFGTVIATFLSMYSNVNTFHQLELVNKDNQERWTWSAHPLLKQSLVN